MEKSQVLETLKREKLVPVIRTESAGDARKVVGVLSSTGIRVFEITMTVPDAIDLIGELAAANPDLLIGAGTVLDQRQAADCIDAGARFIVSPAFDRETVGFCRDRNVAVMPGTLTPTEVLAAWKAGADCVKVFPCDLLGGPKYLKTLKTLFPHIEMMPTGGVNLETVGDFFRAGAVAVGVGTDLVDTKAIRQDNFEAIGAQAKKYLRIVEPFKGEKVKR
ncbi:MAG: bifunctional 4-hydroxy-2-oxoglutarate aldolase/2-dehydro-3-deoxy-phosphogluconate aldolase [Pyrinomonadaceae bacterium]